jgi:hypothetical protein
MADPKGEPVVVFVYDRNDMMIPKALVELLVNGRPFVSATNRATATHLYVCGVDRRADRYSARDRESSRGHLRGDLYTDCDCACQ